MLVATVEVRGVSKDGSVPARDALRQLPEPASEKATLEGAAPMSEKAKRLGAP